MKEEFRKKLEDALASEELANSQEIKDSTWSKLDINQSKNSKWKIVAIAILLLLLLAALFYKLNNLHTVYEEKILKLEAQIASISEEKDVPKSIEQAKIDTIYVIAETKPRALPPDTIYTTVKVYEQQTDTIIINKAPAPEIITIKVRDTIYIEKEVIPRALKASIPIEDEKPSSVQFIFNDKESILKRRKSKL